MSKSAKKLLLSSAMILSLGVPCAAFAEPQGGIVSAGDATITKNHLKTDIHQKSDKAILDWNSFDIKADEHTQFHQPSSRAIALNRIHDTKPSNIDGKISANGRVMLINSNGMVFGDNAVVDVGALTVSTADIDDDDFMAGNYNFKHAGKSDAQIINKGLITAKEKGLITLVAPRVENHGIIAAKLGKIELAAADKFTLDMAGDGLIQVAISDEDAQKLASNSGIIAAEGGMVAITAAKARNVVDSLVENSGIIEAASMKKNAGKIILGGADTNLTINNGVLNASGRRSEVQGGQIEVLGQHVVIAAKSVIDASGTADKAVDTKLSGTSTVDADKTIKTEMDFLADERRGGGSIKVGGDYLGTGDTARAKTLYVDENSLTLNDGLEHGDGGRTIFWSDETTDFSGLVLARGGALSGHGGFLETSGKIDLKANGFADLTAQADGYNKGTYLLDPANITIYGNFTPDDIGNLEAWFDAADNAQITLAYSTDGIGAATASGTIGTNTITTSADVSSALEIGARIRLTNAGAVTTADTLGADTYTITAIAGTTITVAETLSATYTADTLYRGLAQDWANKAGAEVASQSVASNRPLWVDNTLNGNGVLSFDGVNDHLDAGDVFDLHSNNRSTFSVFNLEDNTNGVVYAKSYYSGQDSRYALIRSNGNLTTLLDIGSANNNVSVNGFSSNAYTQASTVTERGAQNTFYLNGAFQGDIAIAADFDDEDGNNHFFVGVYNDVNGIDPRPGFYLNGHVPEIIMYNTNLGKDQQALVNQYQSAKWDLALDPLVGAGTEAAEAMDTTNGYGAFTTDYLERLSASADIILQADSSITLDLQNDTFALDTGRSISLSTVNGNITDTSAGTVRTDNGNITITAGGVGNIDLDTTDLEALNGGVVNLTAAGGDIDLVQNSALNLGAVNGQNIAIQSTNGIHGNDRISTNGGGDIDLSATNDIDLRTSSIVSGGGDINLNGFDVLLNTSINAGTGDINVTATQDIILDDINVTDGLVGHWGFNEGAGSTAANAAGGGNTGSLSGDATWSADTPFHEGFSVGFDGNDGLVDIGNLGLGNNEKSLNLWLNPDNLTNERRIISSTDNTSFSIRFNGTGIDVWGSAWRTIIPVAGNTNEWTNYTFNFDGAGNVTGYVSDAVQSTNTVNENWDNIGIGDELNNTHGTHYDGLIDGVRIYNKMLDELAILQLANPIWQSGTTVLNAGRDITLNSIVTATDTGNAIVAAAGRNFINNHGAGALNATHASGRFLVYSADPADNTLGGQAFDFKRYNKTFAGYAPSSVTETGNGFLYSIAPTLTITADNKSREYGEANPALTYSVTGFIDSDTAATFGAISGAAMLNTTAGAASNAGNHAITAAAGTLASDMGYQFSFTNGTLGITPATLEVKAENYSFVQGTPTAATYTYSGFKNGETLGTSGVTGNADLNIGNLASLIAGIYTLDLDLSGLNATNYSFSEKIPKGILQVNAIPAQNTTPQDDLPNTVQQTISNPVPRFTQMNKNEKLAANQEEQNLHVTTPNTSSNNVISASLIEIDKPVIDFYDLCSYNINYCN